MSDFCKEKPTDPEWLRVAKRLTVVLDEDKEFEKALPILEAIDNKEKTSESHFRLYWTLFQDNQFAKLTEAKPPFANDKFGKDTAELVREAHLRVATQEIDKNDFSSYEKNVKGYLDSNPEESKKEMVQRDYMARLLDRGSVDQVQGMLLPLPAKQRFTGNYSAVTRRVIDEYVKKGEFEKADELLKKNTQFGAYKEFDREWYAIDIGMGRELTSAEVLRLSKGDAAERKYILGLLALIRPDSAIAYFDGINAARSPDKPLLFLAHQVKDDTWEVNLDPKTLAILGDIVPKELR